MERNSEQHLRLKFLAETAGPSPEIKANWFSYFTWHWVQPFIRLGNQKPVQAEDLYELLPHDTAQFCENDWKKNYEKQKQTTNTPIVWKLMYKSSGRDLLCSFLCCPLWLGAVLVQVFVLRALVSEAENLGRKLQWWRDALLVLGMLFASILQSITQQWTFTYGQKAGMKIKAAVSMAVFNKLMELRTVALADTSSGNMLNLVTNDTQKFLDCATFVSFSCFGVVVSLVVAAIAIAEVGISALPGVAVIILGNPAQMLVGQAVGKVRNHAVKFTDARVRMMGEVFYGVRVVKYYGWTTAFLKRISDIRALEVRWIRRASFLRASISTLKDSLAALAGLATFGTYIALHQGQFSASSAFTILGLYGILARVYTIMPTGIQYLMESYIGVQRLERLLNLPNGKGQSSDEDAAQLRKLYPEAALAVSGGIFDWDLKEMDSGVPKRAKSFKVPFRKQIHTDPNGSSGKASSNSIEEPEKSEPKASLGDVNLVVTKGELIAVTGSVGSGKSSLLYAILGEMECLQGSFWIERKVSYAPQQPWILNDTVRNNIITSNFYDKARYKEVVFACALDHDFRELSAGDQTEIGAKGVNISGGQKARMSLARACYSPSSVVLLDDPFAAVDVPTARHLMEHVLNGVLKGRTVVLVTHSKFSLELVDRVFMMDKGGLQEVGSKEEVIEKVHLHEDVKNSDGEPIRRLSIDYSSDDTSHDEELLSVFGSSHETLPDRFLQDTKSVVVEKPTILTVSLMTPSEKSMKIAFGRDKSRGGLSRTSHSRTTVGSDSSEESSTPDTVGTLTLKEDRVLGKVTWQSYIDYARGGGSLLFVLVMVILCFSQAVRVYLDYWISAWVTDKFNLSTGIYLMSYGVLVAGASFVYLLRAVLFNEAAIRSAKHMHTRMVEKVLRSPQAFFDQNPVGRILNRFTKDQQMVDEALPLTAQGMFENLIGVLGVMIFIAVITPWFLLVLPPFVAAFWYCQQRYVAVSRELKRLEGLSRSPIYAHFAQTLQGIASVRAYGMEGAMHDQFRDLVDANNRAFILFVHTSRWLGIRLDLAATLCAGTTALLTVVFRDKISPGLIGVMLIQSIQLCGLFQYGVRLVADTENLLTSVERIQAYGNLRSEADPNSPPGLITELWPEKGEVEFVNYTMAYRTDLPPVLNNLSFKVFPQEKVGILGRTGAGKSSLAAALFRMVENAACTGSILVDAVDLKMVGLDDLRLRLSIIPQDPVLFKGTVRLNLDPFDTHTDVELHEALAKVELTNKIRSLNDGLDSVVAENGDNFSLGQRQLLCLARSLLRRSRIIVMDEATAAVDQETDQLIQRTMRSVSRDSTVLTIAHRIETIIDCDRVLVLARGGRVSEFDSPANLLRRAEDVNFSDPATRRDLGNHVFANMVAQAGPTVAQRLREAAEVAHEKRQKKATAAL